MKTFAFTSLSFTGEILYTYDDSDHLVKLEISADLSREQHEWILKHIPASASGLHFISQKVKNSNIVELMQDISFDQFWNKYDEKLRSSKKKSMVKWNKLSQADRNKAFYFISTYNRNRGSADKKYAETYLNAELWNN